MNRTGFSRPISSAISGRTWPSTSKAERSGGNFPRIFSLSTRVRKWLPLAAINLCGSQASYFRRATPVRRQAHIAVGEYEMCARKIGRKDRLQEMKLRAEIEAERKRWRECIMKIRLDGRIGCADFSRIVEFIVENRQCECAIFGNKSRRRAMRRDGKWHRSPAFWRKRQGFSGKSAIVPRRHNADRDHRVTPCWTCGWQRSLRHLWHQAQRFWRWSLPISRMAMRFMAYERQA
ncbi:hypothetical protein BR141012304_20007 [Brucella inopinata]|nr:hypothetical protein BR141012304_20007 [Brucella inopinata]